MTTREITVTVEESVAREAEARGLLRSDAIEALLRNALRRDGVDNLFNAMSRLDHIENPPLTSYELESEIRAAREARRGNARGA